MKFLNASASKLYRQGTKFVTFVKIIFLNCLEIFVILYSKMSLCPTIGLKNI